MLVEIGFWNAGSVFIKSVCECLGCEVQATRVYDHWALFSLNRQGVDVEGIEISIGDCWVDIEVNRDETEVFSFSYDDPKDLVKIVKILVKLLRT